MGKIDLKELKQQLENASKVVDVKNKEFANMEKSATDKFMGEIKGYVPHERYKNVTSYLKTITDDTSKINCLILESEQGIGKTTIIKNILKSLGKEIFYINSYTTALSFYKAVYHNRFKHIVLDDVFGLYSDEKGIAILRALTNTEDVRYIKYESTSDKLDVPSNFIFEGSVTILTNKITLEMDNSLLGRAIHRKIYFTLKEKLDFMESIAKFHYKKLTKKEMGLIMKFIIENVDETIHNFSFRSVIKIIEFFNHSKENWKELGLEELEVDEELVFVKSIMNLATEERNKKWVDERGKSVRTLRRRIKELSNRTKGQGDRNVR